MNIYIFLLGMVVHFYDADIFAFGRLKELTEILEEKIKLVEKLENEINTLKEKVGST